MAIIRVPIGPGPKKDLLTAIGLMKKALYMGIHALDRFEQKIRQVRTMPRKKKPR